VSKVNLSQVAAQQVAQPDCLDVAGFEAGFAWGAWLWVVGFAVTPGGGLAQALAHSFGADCLLANGKFVIICKETNRGMVLSGP